MTVMHYTNSGVNGLVHDLQNSEILSLTYGSIVRQLITDLEDMDEVNKQLDVM